MNYIPVHKAELKRILNLVVWDGQSFGSRETAGHIHIYTNNISELSVFPTILVAHQKVSIRIQDTGTNLYANIYRIRLLTSYSDNSVMAEEALEELTSLIAEKLSDYMAGDNSTWENLMFSDGSEIQQYADGLLCKDVMISVTNEVNRKNNYL